MRFRLSLWTAGCGSSERRISARRVRWLDSDSGSPGEVAATQGIDRHGQGGTSACTCKLVGDTVRRRRLLYASCDPVTKIAPRRSARAKHPQRVPIQDVAPGVQRRNVRRQRLYVGQPSLHDIRECAVEIAQRQMRPVNGSCRTAGNSSWRTRVLSKFCRNGSAPECLVLHQNGDVCASDFECCGTLHQGAGGRPRHMQAPSAPEQGCTVAGEVCGAGARPTARRDERAASRPAVALLCARARRTRRRFVCQPPTGAADRRGLSHRRRLLRVRVFKTTVSQLQQANATDTVGRCDNGNAATGRASASLHQSCNAENNCCSATSTRFTACQQDLLVFACTCTHRDVRRRRDRGKRARRAPTAGLPAFRPVVHRIADVPAFVCGGVCAANEARARRQPTAAGLPCVATLDRREVRRWW